MILLYFKNVNTFYLICLISLNYKTWFCQGWYNTLKGCDGLMGARNTRASQSPLHSEIEVLIWAMECMRNLRQFSVTFATDFSQLVKMVSEPEEWPAFASYLEDITILKRSFNSSEIIHISRTHNSKADSLARRETTVAGRSYGCGATGVVCKIFVNLLMLLTKIIISFNYCVFLNIILYFPVNIKLNNFKCINYINNTFLNYFTINNLF